MEIYRLFGGLMHFNSEFLSLAFEVKRPPTDNEKKLIKTLKKVKEKYLIVFRTTRN